MLKIILLFMVLSFTVVSAEDDTVIDRTQTEQTGEKTADNPGGRERENKAPETFDPTEEISEDYSIPFPVDI